MADDIAVAALDDLPDGEPVLRVVAGTKYAVVRMGDEVCAIADRCSHAEASLSEGFVDVDEATIECPRHGALFDLHSGEALTLPAVRPVAALPVCIVQRDGVSEVVAEVHGE